MGVGGGEEQVLCGWEGTGASKILQGLRAAPHNKKLPSPKAHSTEAEKL